jgi:hypothetical protein
MTPAQQCNKANLWTSQLGPMLTGVIVCAIVYSVTLALVVRGENRAVRELRQFRITNEARLSEVIHLQNEQTQVLALMIQCLLQSNVDSTARQAFNACLIRAEELTAQQRLLLNNLLEDRLPSRSREPWVARDYVQQYLTERTLCNGLKQLAIPLELHTAQLLRLLQTSKKPACHI